MRRAFALILLAASASAQSIVLGPEHDVLPVSGSAKSQLMALLPRGDAAVAFVARTGKTEAIILDRKGNVQTRTPIDVQGPMTAAATRDGFLVAQSGRVIPLDFDFHARPALAMNGVPLPTSIACGETRCLIAGGAALSIVGIDGSGEIPLRFDFAVTDIAATANAFFLTYSDAAHVAHAATMDADGHVRSDVVLPGVKAFLTALQGGAIAVGPDEFNRLRATRLDASGAIVATRTMVNFNASFFGRIAIACGASECTAAIEWIADSAFVVEGAQAPEQIYAFRFTTALDPIDAAPVAITTTRINTGVRAIATPLGTLMAWTSGFGSATAAFLGSDGVPYDGDVTHAGHPLLTGAAGVLRVAATKRAVAWTEVGAAADRTVRAIRFDGNGDAIDAVPLTLAADQPASAPAAFAFGALGDGDLAAWQTDDALSFGIAGGATQAMRASIASPILTDGRDAAFFIHDALSSSFVRFHDGGAVDRVELPILPVFQSGIWYGDHVLATDGSRTYVIDLARRTVSSRIEPENVLFSAAAADARFAVVARIGDVNADTPLIASVGRYALDGRALDAHDVLLGTSAAYGFPAVAPFAGRFLVAWARLSGAVAALFDPETRTATAPFAIGGGVVVALVPIDDRRVVAVFTHTMQFGDDLVGVLSYRTIRLGAPLHERATR